MRTYEKPLTEILVIPPFSLLSESIGNDPNRDKDDEDGGTMGNTGFFDDLDFSGKNKLWDD